MPATVRQRAPRRESEPRRLAARSLYRYVPVPPVGVDDEGYLCEDGMSQNGSHWKAASSVASVLDAHFAGRAAVHADLPMAYAEGDRSAVLCPDVMVSLGARELELGNWKLWQRPTPDFVLEVLSSKTWRDDVGAKKDAYEFLGVRECWLFDVHGKWLDERLQGYRLRRGAYARIKPDAKGRLLSEALGLELRAEGKLVRFVAEQGERLRTHAEERAARGAAERQMEEQDARIAELEAQLKASRRAPS